MAFFGRRNGLITAASLQWCVCSLLLLSLGRAQGLAVGDAVCAEGYIMDETCIVLETLIDNPSVRTLENPGVHSLHCLLDVASCRESHYTILGYSGSSFPPYNVRYQVDDAGKQLLIQIGRSVGVCSTCASTGRQLQGFRAEVRGTITELGSGVNGSHVLNVTSARSSYNMTNICQNAFAPSPVAAPVEPPSSDRFSFFDWFLNLFSRFFNLFS